MVKFGRNKLKVLNKLAKKQNVSTNSTATVTNKVIKKKLNADKKVTFQKEVLLRKSAESPLVKKVSAEEIILNELSKKPEPKSKPVRTPTQKKIKPVEKQKKRQKTQISDTKLLINLMKKK